MAFLVVQFEDGSLYGLESYATADEAVAAFRAKVRAARERGLVFEEPDVVEGFVYIREEGGSDKTQSFALVGIPYARMLRWKTEGGGEESDEALTEDAVLLGDG
jgi:hypothetical protein